MQVPNTLDESLRAAVAAAVQPLADELRAVRTELAALRAGQAPRLVTVAEAAEHAHVSPCTLRRWERAGVVRSVRRGRRVLVDLSSLQPTDPTEIAALARGAQMSSAGVAGGSPSVAGQTLTGRRTQNAPKGTP